MLTVVAMPCLNEATLIERAVASLGFGAEGTASSDTVLVVVDNGSTDGTIEKLEAMRRTARKRIVLAHEPVRGFVPARRRGADEAKSEAARLGVPLDRVLVLQADADTEYRDGYVDAMRRAAEGAGNAMLEGATRRPAGFVAAHPLYVEAERVADAAVEPLDAADEDEVVVDDKVCGFLLSNYDAWGGHREEWDETGDPIHAETTRLFIRARLSTGARKVRVNPAGAASSRRRIYEDPRLQFVTSGFPRSRSWVSAMCSLEACPIQVDVFAEQVLHGEERDAIALRRAHQLALFRILPAIIERAEAKGTAQWPADIARVLAHLPRRSKDELIDRPGLAITDVLALVDRDLQLLGLP